VKRSVDIEGQGRRSVHVVVLAVLSLLLLVLGPIPSSLARPSGPRQPVARPTVPKAIDVGSDAAAGYGTGTVIHADALRSGAHSLVGLDVAFSGASWSSAAPVDDVINEVRRRVAPKLLDKRSFGRGTGLELGIGAEPSALIGQLSQAAAPESTKLIEKVIGPIEIKNIVRAELLRSQAQARAVQNGCVFGPDKGYGLGSVLNLEVLGGLLATVARPPFREVVQSSSTTRIVRGSTPGRLGLKSETRQTIAPVTFFKGAPYQFTIEVLGEWALRAVADGVKGSVHYGPLKASPETPIVRILDSKGQMRHQLTTQMLLGGRGLVINLGVAEIAIGEDPRMIGGGADSAPIVDGTAAVAAVDVVRVRLLEGQVADVRVGHMEAAVTVPTGGVKCPGLKVDHEVDKPNVMPGDEFTYTIDVTNPHDCVLEKVKVVDTPKAKAAGVKFELKSLTPSGGSLENDIATFPDIGPLGPGETKTVKVKVKVPADSAKGALEALAVVTGICPVELLPSTDVDGPLTSAPRDNGEIPVRGEDTVDGPTVGVCVVPNLKGQSLTLIKNVLEDAGCKLGDVTEITPSDPDDTGKVVDQKTPPDTTVPIGTPVNVDVGGPLCTVPNVSGVTPEAAKDALEKAGCKLGTVTTDPTGKPEDAGKITTQNPPAGDKVPVGTTVDVTISPPACNVPNVVGMTEPAAKDALEKAGCKLGDVKPGPDNPEQAGKITEQDKPSGSLQPAGTDVDITIAGPVCTIPNLVGMSEADARSAVEAQGCTLRTDQRATTNPAEIGKVMTQNPVANLHVPKGSPVDVTLGVQVAGETTLKSQAQDAGDGAGAAASPALVRTGGVALGGLALWLLFSGALTKVAGSRRLWRLVRRQRG
jgi:uncharacterized repeat protein (TIGR01451 family)